LHSLEEFVNDTNFSIDYVLQLGETGLKEKIKHIGLGNKNFSDLFAMFTSIKQFMETHHHFPQTIMGLTTNKGVCCACFILCIWTE